MKKILLTLVVIITGLFLVACDNELDNFKTRIGIGFQGTDSINSVTEDIVLRNSIMDISIEWESDSEAIIVSGSLGKVARQTEDIDVTLTASFNWEDKIEKIIFKVKVIASINDSIDFEAIFNQINLPNQVDSNLNLPLTLDGASLLWVSNTPNSLSNDGVVNQSDENVSVELTVTASKDGQSDTKTFTVVVLALDVEPVDFETIFNQINVPSETDQNISLPTSIDGAELVWSSNKPQTISNSGTVTRTDENVLVELTVTASKDGQSDSKTFTVVVLALDVAPGFNYDEIFNQINIPLQLSNNISLPTTISGVQLTWDSSNLNAITTTGIVTRGSSDVSVTLTVTAVKVGFDPASKDFQVTVKKVDAPVSNHTPIAEARELAEGATVTIQGVNTSLMSNGNYSLQDSSGAIPVYFGDGKNSQLVIGTEYVISGKLGSFEGLVQLVSPTIVQTIGTTNLPEAHDFTGYSLDFDDLIVHEGYVITYKNLEVTSKNSPNNAHEITFKNDAGESTMSRLDTRIGVISAKEDIFKGVNVGEIIDLTNVTVSSYGGKAQFMFTSRSDISVRPKDPSKPQINGIQNFTYIIGVSDKPKYLEGVTATNSDGENFTNNLTVDDSNVNYQEYGNYEVKITLPDVNGYGEMIAISTVYVRNEPSETHDYYNTLEGLTGEAFKTQLQNIITTFEKSTNPNYTTTYNSANDNLQDADEDLTNPNNIILIYNGASIKSTWDSGSTWNKEHVWAKSLLTFPSGGKADTKTNGPGADLHNLRAANPSINSSRGNKEFAAGSGSFGAVSGGWYPGDDHIGDVARIILYMNLRWGDSLANIDDIGNLELFLLWHALDPVDDFERNRNNVIYNAQGNRNPFIDVPEFAYVIWGYPENYSNNDLQESTLNSFSNYGYVSFIDRKSLFVN